eukprot:Pompholyxophrys_punicea_v1_NODE_150_length_3179_cov_6.395006.p2 type:complete len:140 gc:universal NODE_150_length_3179_cov_6.395006:693-274(-)
MGAACAFCAFENSEIFRAVHYSETICPSIFVAPALLFADSSSPDLWHRGLGKSSKGMLPHEATLQVPETDPPYYDFLCSPNSFRSAVWSIEGDASTYLVLLQGWTILAPTQFLSTATSYSLFTCSPAELCLAWLWNPTS